MSRIRDRDTAPEMKVRYALHKMGFRYRLHVHDLPGKPDIVLPKYNTVIFVNGCFWHRHAGCPYSYTPKSRTEFWQKKFDENIRRDKKNRDALQKKGWKVATIWECQTKDAMLLEKAIKKIFSDNISS